MKPLTLILVLVLASACGGEPAETTAPQSTESSEGAATSGIQPAEGVTPAAQSAVRVTVAEQTGAFDPRLPDSRFDPGTARPWMAIYGPDGWSVLLDAPPEHGHYEAAEYRVRVELPGTTTNREVRGSLDVDAIDPATGRIAFTVRGQTADDGAAVSIDVDTTITALP